MTSAPRQMGRLEPAARAWPSALLIATASPASGGDGGRPVEHGRHGRRRWATAPVAGTPEPCTTWPSGSRVSPGPAYGFIGQGRLRDGAVVTRTSPGSRQLPVHPARCGFGAPVPSPRSPTSTSSGAACPRQRAADYKAGDPRFRPGVLRLPRRAPARSVSLSSQNLADNKWHTISCARVGNSVVLTVDGDLRVAERRPWVDHAAPSTSTSGRRTAAGTTSTRV